MKRTQLGNRCWSLCAGLAVMALSLATSETHAQDSTITTMSLTTTVNRTLASGDGRLGGCAARLGHSLQEETGLNCPDNWVTFSCNGTHTSKSDAMRLYDSAQLAFVTGRRAVVWVDDQRKQNGFCFASRVDVLPN